jgi:hypothetical protein
MKLCFTCSGVVPAAPRSLAQAPSLKTDQGHPEVPGPPALVVLVLPVVAQLGLGEQPPPAEAWVTMWPSHSMPLRGLLAPRL